MKKDVIIKIEKLFDLIAEVERIDGMWDTDPEPGDYLWDLLEDWKVYRAEFPEEEEDVFLRYYNRMHPAATRIALMR